MTIMRSHDGIIQVMGPLTIDEETIHLNTVLIIKHFMFEDADPVALCKGTARFIHNSIFSKIEIVGATI